MSQPWQISDLRFRRTLSLTRDARTALSIFFSRINTYPIVSGRTRPAALYARIVPGAHYARLSSIRKYLCSLAPSAFTRAPVAEMKPAHHQGRDGQGAV